MYDSGYYYVASLSGYGCVSNRDSVKISLYPAPGNPVIYHNGPLCESDSLEFYTDSIWSGYSWTGPAVQSTQNHNSYGASPSDSGQYILTVTDTNGCTAHDSALIEVNSIPPLNLGPDTAICIVGSIVLDPGGYGQYTWQDGSTQSTFTVQDSGTYWVSIVNGMCQNSDTVEISTYSCQLAIPNVISPNGDGQNDVWKIRNGKPGAILMVYDRWGKEVLKTTNYQNNWPDEDISAGTYYYLYFPDGDNTNKEEVIKGYLTIIK